MEGIAITNVRGQVVFANQALEHLLGYEPGELVGQSRTLVFADSLHGEPPATPDAEQRHARTLQDAPAAQGWDRDSRSGQQLSAVRRRS